MQSIQRSPDFSSGDTKQCCLFLALVNISLTPCSLHLLLCGYRYDILFLNKRKAHLLLYMCMRSITLQSLVSPWKITSMSHLTSMKVNASVTACAGYDCSHIFWTSFIRQYFCKCLVTSRFVILQYSKINSLNCYLYFHGVKPGMSEKGTPETAYAVEFLFSQPYLVLSSH